MTFCIPYTSLERSLITSSFLLPTLQSVCTYFFLAATLQRLTEFGCHRLCVLRGRNIRVIVVCRKKEDVVSDFFVGSNRRKVHCIVSVGTGTKIVFLLSRRYLVSRPGILVSTRDSHFEHTRLLSQPKYKLSYVGDFLLSFAAASQFLLVTKHVLDGQIIEHEMRGTL